MATGLSDAMTNFYSEISHNSQVCHYQVPSTASNRVKGNDSESVQDEMSRQLIEIKRKRTLKLLKAKEAPRASIEVTSPLGEDDGETLAVLSYYENMSDNVGDSNRSLASPIELKPESPSPPPDHFSAEVTAHADDEGQAVAEGSSQAKSFVISPSESQNLNTLSLISDIQGDLTQEGDSIVQQSSKG